MVAFGAALPLLQTVEQNWFRAISIDGNTKKNIKRYFIVESPNQCLIACAYVSVCLSVCLCLCV